MKKIIKIGSSFGITLSSDQLSKLGLKHGDTVEVDYDKKLEALLVKPHAPKQQNSSNLQNIIDKYAQELEKIDESW